LQRSLRQLSEAGRIFCTGLEAKYWACLEIYIYSKVKRCSMFCLHLLEIVNCEGSFLDAGECFSQGRGKQMFTCIPKLEFPTLLLCVDSAGQEDWPDRQGLHARAPLQDLAPALQSRHLFFLLAGRRAVDGGPEEGLEALLVHLAQPDCKVVLLVHLGS
jgi:hypothetical protein